MSAVVYHGTPINPVGRLRALAGRHFCVSYSDRRQMGLMCEVAAGVMIDNGAFYAHTSGRAVDWSRFYAWLEPHLFEPGRWAVIPDVIAEGSQAQDALLRDWPFGHRGAPVWHTGEPIDRLLRLLDHWPRVCVGSTDEHWQVGGSAWSARMDDAMAAAFSRHSDPSLHMLRGVAVKDRYPFRSVDSSSLAQNGHRYSMPLFRGTADEFGGVVAYADRLEGVRHYG